MKKSSSKIPTSSSASRRTSSAAAIAQSTSRVSLPPDWRIPARPSVSSPSAAVAGLGKRHADDCTRPSGIDEARPERGDARVRVEVRDHPLEAPVVARRVLVEDEDVAAGRRADHGVVVRAEAGAVALLDQPHVRVLRAHRVGRAVLGRVVEHDDLRVDAAQRLEAREEKLPRVRVDERDGDVGQRDQTDCAMPVAHDGGRFRRISTLSNRTGGRTPTSCTHSAIRRRPSSSETAVCSPKTPWSFEWSEKA